MILVQFLVVWYINYPVWQNLYIRGFETAGEACQYFSDLGNEDKMNKTIFETNDATNFFRVRCKEIPPHCKSSWITEKIPQ